MFKNPKPGSLWTVKEGSLYISGGGIAADVSVPVGSIVMFIEEGTYGTALASKGEDWDEWKEEERQWPKDEPFWQLLFEDHIIHLCLADVKTFFVKGRVKESDLIDSDEV